MRRRRADASAPRRDRTRAHACAHPARGGSGLDGETALRFAAEVRALLAAPPEVDALLEALGGLGLPALGDLCVIDIADADGPHRRVVASHLPPDADARVREYFATFPPIVDFTHPALLAGRPLIASFDTPEDAAALFRRAGAARVAAVRALGLLSRVAVPMIARGQLLGVMKFVTTAHSGRRLGPGDAALAGELASQAAYALEHVRLVGALRRELEERRQVEIALREREAQLRQSEAELRGFFHAPATLLSIFSLDDAARDVVFRRPSAALAALYGMTADELVGRSMRALGVDDMRVDTIYEIVRRCRDTGVPVAFDLEPHPGGRASGAAVARPALPPMRCIASRIGDDPRNATIAGLAFDLTELRRSQAELAGFFDAPGTWMAIVELDDAARDIVIRRANPAAAGHFGRTPAAVAGARLRALGLPPALVEWLYARYARCRRTGEAAVFEHAGVPSLGLPPMQLSVRRIGDDPAGSPLAVVMTDLTERQQLAALLEGFFEAPGAPMAILELEDATRDLRVARANAAYAALFGLSRAEIDGRTLRELMRDDALVDERFAQASWCRTTGEPSTCEVRARVGGEARVVLVTLRRIGDDPERGSIATTVLEVTAERRLQAELLQSQKMEAVGQLAGGIAHDFNNVLTVIGAATESLLADGDDEAQRAHDLLDVRRAVERAAELTGQLLAFSRRQSAERHPIRLGDVVCDVYPMLRRLLPTDIDVRLDLADDVPPVLANRGQLAQVLMNFAVNARDAMPDGGTLTIATRHEAADVTWPGSRRALLSVTDTGVGMTEDVRARVFDPFFSTKGPERGTGLGLATVRTIVEGSGGRVWAESSPGAGARFTVALPTVCAATSCGTVTDEACNTNDAEDAEDVEDARSAPLASVTDRRATLPLPDPATAAIGGRETLLLVDQDPVVRLFAARSLRQRGYQVLQAASRDEALALVQSRAGGVDLLISDVALPDATGPELAAALGHVLGPRRPLARVVYMSERAAGDADGASSSPTGTRPIARWIAKPFTADALARAVREALSDET